MKHGVQFFPSAESMSPVRFARAAEERGFESVFFPDHTHVPVVGTSAGAGGGRTRLLPHGHGPIVVLGAVAAATSRSVSARRLPRRRTRSDHPGQADRLARPALRRPGAARRRRRLERGGDAQPRHRPADAFTLLRERIEAMTAIWTAGRSRVRRQLVRFAPCGPGPSRSSDPGRRSCSGAVDRRARTGGGLRRRLDAVPRGDGAGDRRPLRCPRAISRHSLRDASSSWGSWRSPRAATRCRSRCSTPVRIPRLFSATSAWASNGSSIWLPTRPETELLAHPGPPAGALARATANRRATMRAAVLRQGAIVVDDIPEPPPPGPGEILVETVAAGICGSDLHVRRHVQEFVDVNRAIGNDGQLFDPERDVVLGHELSFRVLATDQGSPTSRSGTTAPAIPPSSTPPGCGGPSGTRTNTRGVSANGCSWTRVRPSSAGRSGPGRGRAHRTADGG